MSGSPDTTVTAVVLAARGGPRLARALASVAWADERVVWDPSGRLGDAPLSTGVERAGGERRLDQLGTAAWLLLLEEAEALEPGTVPALLSALRAAGGSDAFRLGRRLEVFGATLSVGGAPIRLARRAGARLRLASGLTIEIAPAGARPRRLDVALVARGAAGVGAALDDLAADGAALAVVLHGAGVRTRLRHLVVAPIVAAARLLAARGPSRLGWGRWIASVLAGYGALVAYASLWEVERRQITVPW